MESKVNYTIVGFFVVMLTAIIIVIALWLTANLQGQSYSIYAVYMTESVAGLSEQSPVKYNGVDVGYVNAMSIDRKNPQRVILQLKIEPNVPITADTTAVIMQQGLTGIAYIGLQGGRPGSPPLVAKAGQPYPVINAVPSFYMRLDQAIQDLTENMNSLSVSIKSLLSKRNLNSISSTLDNLNKFTTTISANDQHIDSSLKSLDTLLANGAKASNQLSTMVQNINSASKNLDKTAQQGDAAIKNFSTQILPQTYNAITNISSVANNLQGFSKSLSQNPAAIIQGKKPVKPGPGE